MEDWDKLTPFSTAQLSRKKKWLCRYHFVWRDDVNHSFAIGLNSHTVPTGWNGVLFTVSHRGWVRISLEDENSNIQVTHHRGDTTNFNYCSRCKDEEQIHRYFNFECFMIILKHQRMIKVFVLMHSNIHSAFCKAEVRGIWPEWKVMILLSFWMNWSISIHLTRNHVSWWIMPVFIIRMLCNICERNK